MPDIMAATETSEPEQSGIYCSQFKTGYIVYKYKSNFNLSQSLHKVSYGTRLVNLKFDGTNHFVAEFHLFCFVLSRKQNKPIVHYFTFIFILVPAKSEICIMLDFRTVNKSLCTEEPKTAGRIGSGSGCHRVG